MKLCVLFFSLCHFYFVQVVFCQKVGSSGSRQDCSFLCERRFVQLERSHRELKEQFELLRQQVNQLKRGQRILPDSDEGIWLLTPPIRGPPGKTGETGQNVDSLITDPESITSCSVAMEASPFIPRKNQSIYPYDGTRRNMSLDVLCDFTTDDGGWTVIQKRSSGPREEFNRSFSEYKNGFGSLERNFWLGLENIHTLTQNEDYELRIDLEDFAGVRRYAKYSNFSVSSSSDGYRLSIGGYSGDAGDSFLYNNGMGFTAEDWDRDGWASGSCAAWSPGGWWFNNCGAESNLNGLYQEKGASFSRYHHIVWYQWKGAGVSLAKTEMKIRKKIHNNFNLFTSLKKYHLGHQLLTSCQPPVSLTTASSSSLPIKHLEALCDSQTDGGNWTIILQRNSGPREEFDRVWVDYVNGFGTLEKNANFWLGLENIHTLTKNKNETMELRIDMEDFSGYTRYAKYSRFSIGPALDFYRLSVGGYSGTAGDSLTYHNSMKFSTKDKDNDEKNGNCAVDRPGGLWFKHCLESDLNGLYRENGETVPVWKGIIWEAWRGDQHSLAKVQMKIRRRK